MLVETHAHKPLVTVEPDGGDAFYHWPWTLIQFIKNRMVPHELAFCVDEEDALAAVQRMRDSWESHLKITQSYGKENPFAIADQLLDQQIDRYKQKYLSLWQRNHRTLLYSTSPNQRNGVSVVLPVSDRAYQRLRAGEITFMDITAADIREESQNIILDSAVELVATSQQPWYRITESLSFSIFYQIATLSQNPIGKDFRILSFGASPVNIERLVAIGFIDCDQVMPEYNFRLCEFLGDHSDLSAESPAEEKRSLLSFFAHRLKRLSATDLRLKAKRRLITRMLRTYQQMIKPKPSSEADSAA